MSGVVSLGWVARENSWRSRFLPLQEYNKQKVFLQASSPLALRWRL